MSEYVPTTEEVVDLWVVYFTRNHDSYMTGVPLETKREEKRAEILRWLAAHDREVAARTLREAAVEVETTRPYSPAAALRSRADKIERADR